MQGIKEPIIFVRFNPDAYKVNSITKRTYKKYRFEKLKKVLDTYETTNEFEILYMFYDTTKNGQLEIQLDNEWNDLLNDYIKII